MRSPSLLEAPGRRGHALGALACAAAIVVCELLLFRYLYRYGVSNIWGADGASQDFPALAYLREWLTATLSGRASSYGMWSWRLGLGADAYTTLSYYIADPFALVSLLFPARMVEGVYQAMFFVRILFVGLAAYYYLITMKMKRFGAIAGTLVYVFAGFVINACLKHPWFLDPMIYFPLILVGTEKVLAHKRWYLLAGALCVAAATDYYFFYQIGIIAIIYTVARYIELTKPGERLRKLAPEGLRVAGWYAFGTVLAAFTLVPVALLVLSSTREASQIATALFYDPAWYYTNLVAMFGQHVGEAEMSGGFAVVGLLAVTLVFMRRGNTGLKIMLGTFGLFLVSPWFGKAMNGFMFPGYRFYFMAGLFIGAAVAWLLSQDEPLTRRELAVTGLVLVAYAALSYLAVGLLGWEYLLLVAPLAIGTTTWGLLGLARLRFGHRTLTDGPDAWSMTRAGVMVLIIAGVAAAGVANYDQRFSGLLAGFQPQGTMMAAYSTDVGAKVSALPADGLQRIDKPIGVLAERTLAGQSNDPLIQGYAGLDFYYSVMSSKLNDYTAGLAIRPKRFAFSMEGFDDRAALDTLNGVRYWVAPVEMAAYAPYGFTRASMLGTQTVYENSHTLPVGYVYHSVVASSTYAVMSPLDKQQALLEGVVLDDAVAPSMPRVVPASETIEQTYTLTPGAGVTWDVAKKRIAVENQDWAAQLTFAPVPDAELYVELAGVSFESPGDLVVAAQGAGPLKNHRFFKPTSGYYWRDTTLLVNLGYYRYGTTGARLAFLNEALIRYSSLRVIAIPMNRYAERVDKLAAEGLRDVRVSADFLSGTVTSKGDGLLFLSIPYSTGWTATVDGSPAPIVVANRGFSGIVVTSGTHAIELRYATPGLKTGIVVSVIALLLAIGLAVLTERRIADSARAAKPTVGED